MSPAAPARTTHRPAGHRARNSVIAALDIGSAKIACVIAAPTDQDDGFRVMGFSHQFSRGVRGGAIVGMDAATQAIGQAVHAAERMAGVTLDRVIVNVSGAHLRAQTVAAEVAVGGGTVGWADMERARARACLIDSDGAQDLLQAIPLAWRVDRQAGMRDPVGLRGGVLGVEVNAVTGDPGVLANLALAISRNHLAIDQRCVAGHAAALATLVEDERDLGCTVLDIGAGTIDIAVFLEGAPVWLDSIAVGGGHITNDIARGLTTPLTQAERIKVLYGAAMLDAGLDRDLIEVPQVGEPDHAPSTTVPRAVLVGIIAPRVEEMLELVRDRLAAAGVSRLAGRRLVLTGGSSQLPGFRELAQKLLDKQARLGRPPRRFGLPEAGAGPAFSVVAGLLAQAAGDADLLPRAEDGPLIAPRGLIDRVGLWFREHLS